MCASALDLRAYRSRVLNQMKCCIGGPGSSNVLAYLSLVVPAVASNAGTNLKLKSSVAAS